MMHPIFRVVSVSVIGLDTLRITFDDALQRDIDFSPVLGGELFRPLRDPALFSQVRVDPEVHTIVWVWPNGADFDPATLHDWPVHCDALAARAREWELRRRRRKSLRTEIVAFACSRFFRETVSPIFLDAFPTLEASHVPVIRYAALPDLTGPDLTGLT